MDLLIRQAGRNRSEESFNAQNLICIAAEDHGACVALRGHLSVLCVLDIKVTSSCDVEELRTLRLSYLLPYGAACCF